jgi:hypothetical protein
MKKIDRASLGLIYLILGILCLLGALNILGQIILIFLGFMLINRGLILRGRDSLMYHINRLLNEFFQ